MLGDTPSTTTGERAYGTDLQSSNPYRVLEKDIIRRNARASGTTTQPPTLLGLFPFSLGGTFQYAKNCPEEANYHPDSGLDTLHIYGN